MVGVEKGRTSSRPFGQGNYNLDLFRPTLEGPHYKFTLLLPVTEKVTGEKGEKAVFTSKDLEKLGDLFNADFGGATYLETKGAPPRKAPSVRGDWMDNNKNKVVVNWHARIEVYTRQHPDAIAYFTELKARLLEHAEKVRQMKQDEIVIERVSVDFVPKTTLKALRTEVEERLKYLKR
ncbi:MAG: hypothetical protein LVQ95_00960 [Candidatus Micrarchaeales archaeon]|nr:hypothetical protein [Candidatus Micrarchaeales archaeon]